MQSTPDHSFCRVALFALALVSLINIVPMLLFPVGGDMNFHLVLFDCFASQFWQGDFYPRWCFAANGGQGAPVFWFYFPLPYYVVSLIWPLTYAGLSHYQLYIVSMFLATLATGLTSCAWLSGITQKPRALLVSMLLLFMPYRMEAMLFRAGYAEIWCMALLPLFFKYVREVIAGQKAQSKLALTVALMLLTHVTLSLVAFIAGGVYVAMSTAHLGFKKMIAVSWRCKLSGIWGIGMAAFYLVPAIYLRRFMLPREDVQDTPWANSYLSMDNLANQGRVVAGDGLAIIVLVLLAVAVLWKLRRASDEPVRRETKAWLGASLVAGLLLFPISSPLYDALRPWSGIVFPWRMQVVFMFATAFLLAVWMQNFIKPAKLKTWKGDFFMLLALLVLLSYFMVGVREDNEELENNILNSHLVAEPEYQTRWQDSESFNDEAIFARQKKQPMQAQIIGAKAKSAAAVKVTQWDAHAIRIESDLPKAAKLRVGQAYFPLWSAMLDGGEALDIKPEEGSGLILVDIPAGKHTLSLGRSLAGVGYVFSLINCLSGWLFIFCAWRLVRYKIARLALTKHRAHGSLRV